MQKSGGIRAGFQGLEGMVVPVPSQICEALITDE